MVSLQRERGKQVLAKAHKAAMTKPGLRYLTHGAHKAARATRSVKQRSDNVRTITGRTREINREKTQQAKTARAESRKQEC